MRPRIKYWEKSLINMKERLTASNIWYPYPALFSFALVILLNGQILISLNPRLGNPATPSVLKGEQSYEGAIWMSVSYAKSTIIVTTYDRKIFTWPEAITDLGEMKAFVSYLESKRDNIAHFTSMQKSISVPESTVVLAVDHALKYAHIKPILYTLARLGFANYAFEVKRPFLTNVATHGAHERE